MYKELTINVVKVATRLKAYVHIDYVKLRRTDDIGTWFISYNYRLLIIS